MHARVWQMALENVARLEAMLDEAMRPFERTERLLRTMPGVGRICAATFIATLGTPHRFETSGQVASYCCLVPSGFDSGKENMRREDLE